MLGNTKLQTCLYIEDILKVLHKHNAPSAVLEKYLKFVDSLEKRLELAKKLLCHTIVIDVCVFIIGNLRMRDCNGNRSHIDL